MLQIVWPMSITNSIYMLAIVATCMLIDRAHCTAGLVFSAHAHKLPDIEIVRWCTHTLQFSDQPNYDVTDAASTREVCAL